MRPMVKVSLGALVLVWAATGCQKLNYTTAFDLQSSGVHVSHIDAPSRDQTVKVVATSSGTPIAVYLVLEKDAAAAENALMNYKQPDPSIILAASKDKAKEVTVEGKVPAKSAYAVLVGGASKTTNVDLKIAGN